MPGAALDEIERIAGAAKIPLEAARLIEAVLDRAEPDAARELALRAAHLYEQSPATGRGGGASLRPRARDRSRERRRARPRSRATTARRRDPTRTGRDPGAARGDRVRPAGAQAAADGGVGAARAAGERSRRRSLRCATLRAAEEGDADVLGELARLYEATHQVADLTDVLAERARFAEAPAERATLYARIGALKLGLLDDPIGRGRRLSRGTGERARGPGVAGGAGDDRGEAGRLVDVAGRAHAAPERGVGARPGGGAAEAGAQRRAEAERSGSEHRVPAPDPRASTAPTARRSWSSSGCWATASAGTTWSTCSASTPTPKGRRGGSRSSWRCGSRLPTSGSRSSTPSRALPRRWKRSWRSRRITSARCCRWRACTKAPSAGTRLARCWSGRRPR